jgi:hypothetical protein
MGPRIHRARLSFPAKLSKRDGLPRAAPAALRPLLADESMRGISPFTFRDAR